MSLVSDIALPCSICTGRWVPSDSGFGVLLSPTVLELWVLTLASVRAAVSAAICNAVWASIAAAAVGVSLVLLPA